MRTVLVLCAAAVGLAACGGGSTPDAAGPRIVVTTSILGDVVEQLVGDAATVDVLMPPGSDPHSFAPSARQAAALREADLVVVNGLGFEAGLVDAVEGAEDDGVEVVTAADAVEGADPHFFTDPVNVRAAAEHVAAALADVDGVAGPAFDERVDGYLAALDALDAEVERLLAPVPVDRRTLVTNHDVFGAFAARYGFEVLGAVIPGGSTLAEPSAADLAALAHLIDEAGVPAIFAETSSPTRLADALAAEGADVDVVELYSEALGEPGSDGATYLDLVRTNAARIAAALR